MAATFIESCSWSISSLIRYYVRLLVPSSSPIHTYTMFKLVRPRNVHIVCLDVHFYRARLLL